MAVEDYCRHYVKRAQATCARCDEYEKGRRAALEEAARIAIRAARAAAEWRHWSEARMADDIANDINRALAAEGDAARVEGDEAQVPEDSASGESAQSGAEPNVPDSAPSSPPRAPDVWYHESDHERLCHEAAMAAARAVRDWYASWLLEYKREYQDATGKRVHPTDDQLAAIVRGALK